MNISDFELTKIALSVKTNENTHDRTNIHHGFLSLIGVIPSEWELDSPSPTPTPFSIRYKNNIRLFGDQRAFRVTQTGNLVLGERPPALDVLVRYTTSVSPNTFVHSEVDFDMRIPHENATTWIEHQFVSPNVINHDLENALAIVGFAFTIENSKVWFVCGGNDPSSDGTDPDFILMKCQVSRQSFSNDKELLSWWTGWNNLEKLTLEKVALLMGAEYDIDQG